MATMKEFDLLQHVYQANAQLGQRVELPPGDDMAMVRLQEGTRLLAAVDQLVDGRHVQLVSDPLELVGRKAITRSLSDIAAMAARPVATLVAATLPPDFGEQRANALFDAMRKTAAQYDSPLIGGDLAFHSDAIHPLVCAVTVLAEPGPRAPVTRGGAKLGDMVYVTGDLGGAYRHDGVAANKHLTFSPRIDEALALAEVLGENLHAMIDISDGLGRDAGHIAAQSNVAIELDAHKIPCTADIGWKQAMTDGEDYELCFTASGSVPKNIGDVAITCVGRVIKHDSKQPRVRVLVDGEMLDGSQLGWQHEA
jgi:thiamine-monophosphate kinase